MDRPDHRRFPCQRPIPFQRLRPGILPRKVAPRPHIPHEPPHRLQLRRARIADPRLEQMLPKIIVIAAATPPRQLPEIPAPLQMPFLQQRFHPRGSRLHRRLHPFLGREIQVDELQPRSQFRPHTQGHPLGRRFTERIIRRMPGRSRQGRHPPADIDRSAILSGTTDIDRHGRTRRRIEQLRNQGCERRRSLDQHRRGLPQTEQTLQETRADRAVMSDGKVRHPIREQRVETGFQAVRAHGRNNFRAS